MDRRGFVALLGASVAAASGIVVAQTGGRVPKIGVLLNSLARTEPLPQAFLRRLAELGYVDGKSAVIAYRFGLLSELSALAAELVGLKVDLIYTVSLEAALAAHAATQTIPIVFVVVGDPVRAGLVESLGRPGGNATGISETGSDLGGKRLELLKELKPDLARVGVVWVPERSGGQTNPTAPRKSAGGSGLEQIENAARALGIRLHPYAVQNADELAGALGAITRAHAGALMIQEGPLMYMNRQRIVDFAAANKLPAIYGVREFVVAGGLMSYGPDLSDLLNRAANYVDRILKGARPGDLPIEQPTKFDLVINLATAKSLGLSVPPSLLLRAADVVK